MSNFETICSVYAELFMGTHPASLEVEYYQHSPVELLGILNYLQGVWSTHIDSFDECGEIVPQSVAMRVYDDYDVTIALFFVV